MRRSVLLVVVLVAGLLPLLASQPVAADVAAPTAGASNVRDFGATGDGSADDTGAFRSAMTAALQPGAVRFANGPTGDPQGVVYVPPGTYRILNLTFPSNLRMEVDAGAVLEQAGGRTAKAPPAYSSPAPTLVLWDGPPGAPLTNVSLVGVGTSTGGRKTVAAPVAPGWSIDNSFTFDLDPYVTNANNLVSALQAFNVDGFVVAHVFSVQNDSQPATTPSNNADWWPSQRKPALVLRARADTPLGGSAFYDPHRGTISDWYNVHAPRGFGLTQVTSGHDLRFTDLYGEGGTTLRLETDNSNGTNFGSEVRSLTATHVVGRRCNRAAAFAPHQQDNTDIAVSDVTATGCYQGVVEAVDESVPSDRRGSFLNTTLTNVNVVAGAGAQLPVPNSGGLWSSGGSSQAFARDRIATWAVIYAAGTYACSGAFPVASTAIETTAGEQQPDCGGPPIAAPTGLTASARSTSKIRLNWTAVGGASGYRVSRATTSGGPYVAVVDTSKPSFTDTHLRKNTTYFYVVQALNGTTASGYSSEASATTLS